MHSVVRFALALVSAAPVMSSPFFGGLHINENNASVYFGKGKECTIDLKWEDAAPYLYFSCYVAAVSYNSATAAAPSASASPSTSPTASPSASPSVAPSASPSASPSSASPSTAPSASPSTSPSATPSASPSATPSAAPSATPCCNTIATSANMNVSDVNAELCIGHFEKQSHTHDGKPVYTRPLPDFDGWYIHIYYWGEKEGSTAAAGWLCMYYDSPMPAYRDTTLVYGASGCDCPDCASPSPAYSMSHGGVPDGGVHGFAIACLEEPQAPPPPPLPPALPFTYHSQAFECYCDGNSPEFDNFWLNFQLTLASEMHQWIKNYAVVEKVVTTTELYPDYKNGTLFVRLKFIEQAFDSSGALQNGENNTEGHDPFTIVKLDLYLSNLIKECGVVQESISSEGLVSYMSNGAHLLSRQVPPFYKSGCRCADVAYNTNYPLECGLGSTASDVYTYDDVASGRRLSDPDDDASVIVSHDASGSYDYDALPSPSPDADPYSLPTNFNNTIPETAVPVLSSLTISMISKDLNCTAKAVAGIVTAIPATTLGFLQAMNPSAPPPPPAPPVLPYSLFTQRFSCNCPPGTTINFERFYILFTVQLALMSKQWLMLERDCLVETYVDVASNGIYATFHFIPAAYDSSGNIINDVGNQNGHQPYTLRTLSDEEYWLLDKCFSMDPTESTSDANNANSLFGKKMPPYLKDCCPCGDATTNADEPSCGLEGTPPADFQSCGLFGRQRVLNVAESRRHLELDLTHGPASLHGFKFKLDMDGVLCDVNTDSRL